MQGLEAIQAMIEGRANFGNMADTLNMRAVEASQGYLRIEVQPGIEHLNAGELVHGGYGAAVLDMATGMVVLTLLGEGEGSVTVELNIQMMKPLPLETQADAIGRVVKRTRNLAFTRGEIRIGETLYATATSTVMIRPGDSAAS